MPNRVRGARDPREGLCLAQGRLLPIGLTWLVRTLHMAAVLVGELRKGGINKGWGELPSPTTTPQHLPRCWKMAHPAPEAYSEAELRVHIHFVQYVHLEKMESVSQLLSLTQTAHRHPSAHLLPYRDPEIQWMPQPAAWSYILTPQDQEPLPAHPH